LVFISYAEKMHGTYSLTFKNDSHHPAQLQEYRMGREGGFYSCISGSNTVVKSHVITQIQL